MRPRGGAPQGTARRVSGGDAGLFAAVFLGYAAGSVLAWESFGSAFGPAFFFPPAGVTVAAIILTRRARWPVVGSAAFLAELVVDSAFGNPVGVVAGFAAANVLESLVGASLVLAWCHGPPDLRRRRDFWMFVAGACLSGPAVGGLVGGIFSAHQFGTAAVPQILRWWSGDALGVLVVAAPILLWTRQSAVVREHRGETAVVLAAAAAGTLTVFRWGLPPSLLVLPVLAWAAVRLGMLGVALAGAVVAFLANVMVSRGFPVAVATDVNPAAELALTQVLVATLVAVSLLIAQEAGARSRAVRGLDEERRERLRLEALSGLARQLAAALTPRDIGGALERQLLSVAGAQGLTMALVSDDRRDLECIAMAGFPEALVNRYGEGIPLAERSVGTDVIRSGEPVAMHSFAEYAAAYPEMAPLVQPSGDWSILGWPLGPPGEPIGVLVLTWAGSELPDPAQRAFVSAVATMVSQALVRAKAYVDERARAGVLRSAAHPAAPARVDGAEVGACYEPADVAGGLGGDWYDVMALPGDRIYLAVGDVVGHGMAAVEDMAQLRSAERAFAHHGLEPAALLAAVNPFTAAVIYGEFATSAVAVYHRPTRSLSYSSAGHPPALLRRAATGEVIRLSGGGCPPLGLLPDAEYTQGSVAVDAGDVLVMYTDGLVEHGDIAVTTGIDRLQRLVADWPPERLLDCGAVVSALAPPPCDDDVCLVVARFGEGP